MATRFALTAQALLLLPAAARGDPIVITTSPINQARQRRGALLYPCAADQHVRLPGHYCALRI